MAAGAEVISGLLGWLLKPKKIRSGQSPFKSYLEIGPISFYRKNDALTGPVFLILIANNISLNSKESHYANNHSKSDALAVGGFSLCLYGAKGRCFAFSARG